MNGPPVCRTRKTENAPTWRSPSPFFGGCFWRLFPLIYTDFLRPHSTNYHRRNNFMGNYDTFTLTYIHHNISNIFISLSSPAICIVTRRWLSDSEGVDHTKYLVTLNYNIQYCLLHPIIRWSRNIKCKIKYWPLLIIWHRIKQPKLNGEWFLNAQETTPPVRPSHNTPRNSQKLSATGVVLHQPLNCAIFWFLGLFWPKNERDSCIPQVQKRRTPLPGDLRDHFFGVLFWTFLLHFHPLQPRIF